MRIKTRTRKIRGSWEAASIFLSILRTEEGLGSFDVDKEHFWIVCLDTKNNVTAVELITLGLLDQTAVHPREVFRPAIYHAAKSIILAHNHPSGDPQPSDKDMILTKRLADVGVILGCQVLDHLIVAIDDEGRDTSVSLAESNSELFAKEGQKS
jgi:DNA repair protein RadC